MESTFECIWEKITRCLNLTWQCLNPTWQNSRWLPSSSPVWMNEFEWDWISLSQSQSGGRVFLSESAGVNTRCRNSMMQKLNPRWQNSRRPNSRWPPSSSWVRMNEFESDWISLIQNQSEWRVFLRESERKIQGVWIPWYRNWIQDGRIQEGQI